MKEITLSITVTVSDDETDKYWDRVLSDMEYFVHDKGYQIYEKEWYEVKY